jgi:stage II sporulation protein GA (sporulation sigma-E factor processing peptidase)
MTVEIYLDIIVLENIVVNYLILMVTARFSRTRTSSLRLFLGALAGALYLALMILLPGMKIYTTVLSKVLLSFAMIAITFYLDRISTFIKTLALFYAVTFLFAGAGFALLFFNNGGGIIRNGVIITSLPLLGAKWSEILLALALTLIILRIFRDLIQSRLVKDKLLVQLLISFDSKAIGLYALVDTGNSLFDPLTNTPVVVVEFSAIKDILPAEIRSIFEKDRENDLGAVTDTISGTPWFSRFRLIPFTSLGKENGMLIGFRPDYIEIDNDHQRKGISDVIVGIYNRALSRNEKYKALLNPELI